MRYAIVITLLAVFAFSGHLAFAQVDVDPSADGGLVPPCNEDVDKETGKFVNPCGFDDFMLLVQRILNYVVYASVFVAAIVFMYAGFLYVTAAGDPGKVGKAHKLFWNVLIGFIIVLGAWLMVYTVTSPFLRDQKLLDMFFG